eukprot:3931593-Rhodomonas_salina.1
MCTDHNGLRVASEHRRHLPSQEYARHSRTQGKDNTLRSQTPDTLVASAARNVHGGRRTFESWKESVVVKCHGPLVANARSRCPA